jgi:hypothetical protein
MLHKGMLNTCSREVFNPFLLIIGSRRTFEVLKGPNRRVSVVIQVGLSVSLDLLLSSILKLLCPCVLIRKPNCLRIFCLAEFLAGGLGTPVYLLTIVVL